MTPEQQKFWLDVLDKVLSGSTVGILAFSAIIIFMLLLVFSTPFRDFINKRNWKFGFGDKTLESTPADQPALEPVEEEGMAIAKPAEPEETDEQLDLQEVVPGEDEPPLEEKDDSKFHMMMLRAALRDRDPDKIEEAFQEWKEFDGRLFSDEQIETLRCKMRMKVGVQGVEEELKALEQDNDTWVEPSQELVEYFGNLERFDLAKPHAQNAIDRSKNDIEKAYSYQKMADILIQLGTQSDALELLNNAISTVTENEAKARILDKVADIHKVSKDKLMAEKALEHALNLTPSDKDRRFKLAYTYSDDGKHHLALFHYRILTEQDPHYSFALNNLGVAYGRLDLPGKCVEAWKVAADIGEVYPMGNLAIGLIRQGFYDEASTVINEVPKEQRDDPRVVTAISLIESTKEQEDEELEKHLEATKLRHKYMLLAVEAEQNPEINKLTPKDLVGDWTSASGAELKMDFTKGKGLLRSGGLLGELTESGSVGGLTSLFGPQGPPSQNKFNLHLFKNGLVLTGTGYPVDQQRASILSGPPKNRDYFLVVTGKTKISGIYWTDYKNPQEISFSRS